MSTLLTAGGSRLSAGGAALSVADSYPATAPVAPVLDKTRFLAFYEARTDGNTDTSWQDISGNNRHLTPAGTGYTRLLDTRGKWVYRTTDDLNQYPSWLVPPLSNTAQDYTIYLLIRQQGGTNTAWVLDSGGTRTVLALNENAGSMFSGSWQFGSTLTLDQERARFVWRMNAAGAALWKNNAPLAMGSYTPRPLNGTTTLGRVFNENNNVFRGDLIAFAVAPGNDTDAQLAAVDAYLLSL